MKKILFLFPFFIIAFGISNAQLPNGSTIPDFTFTDIHGVTQNLYTYLNQGKFVALDISTTWCEPCWNYHTSGVMDSLFSLHDTPGDAKWKVLFMEGDGGTDSADVYGIGSSTQGNWAAGTLFPIMNPPSGIALNDFISGYDVTFFPTFYMICPNKKVYQDFLNGPNKPDVKSWEAEANQYCATAGFDNIKDTNPFTIYPNPAYGVVHLYFSLNSLRSMKLAVRDLAGQILREKDFGYLSPGDQSLVVDVSELNPGIYFFELSDDESRVVYKKVVIQ